jgi:tetratricopeptide (TPR) repeat protein
MMTALRPLGAAAMAVVLLAGVAALSYARLTRPVADADAALADGRFEQALVSYAEAEARFNRYAPVRQIFASDYSHVMANQLWLLYRLARYDELIDKAQAAPEPATPHFWSGCAFFEKGRAEEKTDARLAWFTRAEDELRHAIEATPADWDTKYDFELVTRLAAALRKQPQTPPRQLMQLLRPQPKPGARPVKRVG